VLVELMRGYYRDDGLSFDAGRAAATMARLLAEPQWGGAWVLEAEGAIAGYIAICMGFSLELGGNDAYIDELFVLPEHRGRGYGRLLTDFAAEAIAARGCVALHLEVDRENDSALRLYAALGYERRDRYFLMTRRLSPARSS
jgi:ribosomal protein S18 acetylase RimI-like enzyme